jgi:hypothetical protein
MQRREAFEHVRLRYGTDPDYPWHDWNVVPSADILQIQLIV